jgi:menaquinone reductase, integral membrane subunit
MDRGLIARGVERCSTGKFLAWLSPWAALLVFGSYAIWLCLRYGLNQTNMDNRFAFGLWIFLDLTVIAYGAGAFLTGFLVYVFRRHELKDVINSAVVLGFICYSGAVLILAVDVGQPMRAWFTFWHPNAHSMLTEVTFCISTYLVVLLFEYLPVVLKNRKIRVNPALIVFEWQLHKVVPVLAIIGTLLSFFHQGSLGGLYGVLRGRPFAFREGFGIWPTTFFLFVLSAAAVGPSFVLLTTKLVSAISGRALIRPEVYALLARISGSLLLVYVLLKSFDTLVWINDTSPRVGFAAWKYYANEPFGTWILLVEVVLLGLVPALLLLKRRFIFGGALLACAGVAVNRFVLTIQTLALPTLPFDPFLSYWPSWQEVGAFAGVIAYGVLLYSLSYRYLTLFPREREVR